MEGDRPTGGLTRAPDPVEGRGVLTVSRWIKSLIPSCLLVTSVNSDSSQL